MAKVEDKPRISVEGGCGVADGNGVEESRRDEIGDYDTVKDVLAGGGISVEKSIHEARYEFLKLLLVRLFSFDSSPVLESACCF